MKNVLFATSALVSVAGVALADGHTGVSLSGSAEMGITYADLTGIGEFTEFHNDIDVTFTLSGETENGLSFGATIDLDEADGGSVIQTSNSVFISGSFGTLTMGDTDSAYDKAHIELPGAGLNDEADLADGGGAFDFLAPEILRYDYSFGDVTLSASIGLEDQGIIAPGAVSSAALAENVYSVGVGYSGDLGGINLDAGLGYQFTEDTGGDEWSAVGASAKVGFGDFGVQGTYQLLSIGAADTSIYGVGVTYSSGPIGFAAAYELTDFDGGGEVNTYQAYVTYDLTGGAELIGAVGYQDFGGGIEDTYAGFGLGLSF